MLLEPGLTGLLGYGDAVVKEFGVVVIVLLVTVGLGQPIPESRQTEMLAQAASVQL